MDITTNILKNDVKLSTGIPRRYGGG